MFMQERAAEQRDRCFVLRSTEFSRALSIFLRCKTSGWMARASFGKRMPRQREEEEKEKKKATTAVGGCVIYPLNGGICTTSQEDR